MSCNNTVAIKVSVSSKEAEIIDDAVNKGDGKNRADVCRKALILYLEKRDSLEVNA